MTNDEIRFVYVAGPYSQGNGPVNVANAIHAGDRLMTAGYIPFIPHAMTMQWDMLHPHEYETWMFFDEAWLEKCDALVRLPGRSPGADREVQQAMRLGIPVYTLDELIHLRD